MKGQTESTYADHKLPLPPPRSLSSGTNETGTGTALLHYYNVETESFFFYSTNSYTECGGQQTLHPTDEKWLDKKQGRRRLRWLAALVVHLYCAPLV